MAILKKPYEISIWEDKLDTLSGYYKEIKIAVIGSDTMTSPNKAFSPVLTKNVNGEVTFTFSMAYTYFDPVAEKEVINPFINYLINERKVKLHYDNKWFDFLIKNHEEDSESMVWTYTATDAFVNELSKVGYNVEFNTELNNNQGTAIELAKRTLENTDWKVAEIGPNEEDSDLLVQKVNEPMVEAHITQGTLDVLDVESGETVYGIDSQDVLYIFYSYLINKEGKYIQFMLQSDEEDFTYDDKQNVIGPNYRILTDATYVVDENTGIATQINIGNTIISLCTYIDGAPQYTYYPNQGYRIVYGPLTTYDPVMERTVQIYKANTPNGEKDIYKYTDYTYSTSNVVSSFVVNGSNFETCESDTLQGWDNYTESTNKEDNVSVPQSMSLTTYPELDIHKPLASLTDFTQIEGYLKLKFDNVFNNYKNTFFNSGINYNAGLIDHISCGERYVLRLSYATLSDLDGSLVPFNAEEQDGIRALVARYEQVEESGEHNRAQIKHIIPGGVIFNFTGSFEEKDTIVEGGVFNQEYTTYSIDTVPQSPSTKCIYREVRDNTNVDRVWDATQLKYIPVENSNFIHSYYTVAEALSSVSSDALRNSDIGIFLYINNANLKDQYIYVSDIQLTKYILDGNEELVTVGNIPTATTIETPNFYVKPEEDDDKNNVDTYFSLDDLANVLHCNINDIRQVYNEQNEKILSISEAQSNCFNILQTICETFECWLKIYVQHEDDGSISVDENGKSQKTIALKLYAGQDNYTGFKYGINLKSIQRTITSEEIVTKLIVDNVQSDYLDSGIMSIRDASINPSGEAYILNFDYFVQKGLIKNKQDYENDLEIFNSALKLLNNQLNVTRQEKSVLELARTKVDSQRVVYHELIAAAREAYNEGLEDFKELTNMSYNDYVGQAGSSDLPDLTESEEAINIIAKIYVASNTINTYSGILTNSEVEYNRLQLEIEGAKDYAFTASCVENPNENTFTTRINLDDYVDGCVFKIYPAGAESNAIEFVSSIGQKSFEITNNPAYNRLKVVSIPNNYHLDGATLNTETVIPNGVLRVQILPDSEFKDKYKGYISTIQDLQDRKNVLEKTFYTKYSKFIKEGTWSSNEYINANLYYLDAKQVSNTSAMPKVEYSINVVEVSELEGLKYYLFDVGDKTYIEDIQFFGWHEKDGLKMPAREEVIVSQVEWHLDEPETNVITIQNYKTQFEDLFQRISATVQTVQYNEATYAKTSSIIDSDGTLNQNLLLASLNEISDRSYVLTSDGSISIDKDSITIRNLTNAANLVKIDSRGINISNDGGQTWTTALSGAGINAGTVFTGQLNTEEITILDEGNPSFRWDKYGISAYKKIANDQPYDLTTFVRFDQYGLYGIKSNSSFSANSIEDIKAKAHFAVTWDGFFIKNSYTGGGRVSMTSDNDFQVINTVNNQEREKIKIGALEWRDSNGNITTDPTQGVGAPTLYGIRINNNEGQTVLKTGDDGNLTITGTINAAAGEIGGMSVDGTRLRMNHIVLEPGTGIYSDYSLPYPFIISDVDGSATFNNVVVRGSIKTSVFEYEEIQAVGGAFMFRPSTAIREAVEDNGDLILKVEKPLILKDGAWYKLSNYNSDETIGPDELTTYGLTHIYQLQKTTVDNETQIRLLGAAAILQTINIEDIAGGSIIDMGFEPNTYRPMKLIPESSPVQLKLYELVNNEYVLTTDVTVDPNKTYYKEWYQQGINNYGIGINSSDNYINLPPRAISLFETEVNHTQDPKVSYKYKGILGTLPDERLNNLDVDSSIYSQMRGTQGIYTDNMYLGDDEQFLTFYTDKTDPQHPRKRLRIKASQVLFESPDTPGDYEDVATTAGQPGPPGEDAVTVRIESNIGNNFVFGNRTAILSCYVFKGTTDITSSIAEADFVWSMLDKEGTPVSGWVPAKQGTRDGLLKNQIQINTDDVDMKSVFYCNVTFA